jgi:hypothetical protein
VIEDPEALMEDLRTLADAVPLLTKSVAEAREEAEALDAAAHELEREVEAARQDAAARLAAVHEVLPRLAAQADGAETRLEEAAAAAGAAWEAAQPALAEAGEALVKHVGDAVSHVNGLQAALVEATSKIDQLHAAGEAALARLQGDVHDAEERLGAALAALHAQVGSFQGYAQTARKAIEDKALYLTKYLSAALGVTNAHVQKGLEDMERLGVWYQAGARTEVPALSGHLMEQLADSETRIEQAVTAPVADAAVSLNGELERLDAAAGTQEQGLARHGQALDAQRASVKGEADDMPSALAVVREAARQVGI